MNWDPLHELLALRDQTARRPTQPDAAWTPNVDLLETETSFVLVAELPGLTAEDFSIEAHAEGLALSGTRRAPTSASQRYVRVERGHGRFSRVVSFGQRVVVGDIQAAFRHGLLTITVPKDRHADRRITVD